MKLKKVLFVFFSLVVLIIPDVQYNFLNYSDYTNILMILSKLLMVAVLIMGLMLITRSFFWSYLVVGLFYIPSLLVEVVNVGLLRQYTTTDNLTAIINTNKSEIEEFTGRFGVYIFLPLFVIFLWFLLLFLIKKKKFNPTLGLKYLLVLPILIVLVYLLPLFVMKQSKAAFSGKNLYKYTITRMFFKQHPLSLYYRSSELYDSYVYQKKYSKIKERFSFLVKNKGSDSLADVVVLVIGEGMRFENWTVNGYVRQTSPSLSSIKELISFSWNYANANSTSASIPLILSRATPDNRRPASEEKSIISLFKEAGYQTTWILRQNLFYLGNKSEPDRINELYKQSNTDLDVLAPFKNELHIDSSQKKFIIINLKGNHGRVPPKFQLFKPNGEGKQISVSYDNREVLINDYDNKILFQDYVLGELIRELKLLGRRSILLFTSDHGVNLFDTKDAGLFGYGSQNPTEKELHVPLFIWPSKSFSSYYKHKVINLTFNMNKITTNNHLFYTLSDLAGIHYQSENSSKSFAAECFREEKTIKICQGNNYITIKPSVSNFRN